ncbi:DUF2147 domain-containing protein [Flammeovirga aprica]|uniref:DUF2147 domain-containing protein n=1 Tax=Flammeovirga aprica JL-4 TaxID=694437 RepID=A0A7X9P324_9BACT|nr:hypothetical protein [Flammeovirga aprica]NME68092.1 hypothetical protein [Flammeovirga aprica JL-4]
MKKFISLLLFILITSITAFAQTDIEGTWDMKKDGTIVTIKKADSIFEGFVISTESEADIVGKKVIRDIKPTKNGFEGEIYAIKLDKWLEAKFKPDGDIMEVKASLGFVSRTMEWDRK